VVDWTTLTEQLQEARRTGIAYDRGENEEGALCIAVPLLVGVGTPLAALSISAPAPRFEGKMVEAAVAALKEGAGAIEKRLRDTGLSRTLAIA
jgi:DNA-binding IclR family transcriptional regulator